MNTQLRTAASVAEIDRHLPQTQCTACGFADCQAYAEALFSGRASGNRCPPGGAVTRSALNRLLDHSDQSLADDCQPFAGRQVATIIESQCIGCTLCIGPCPVDAIVGAARQMHSVLTEECTGCNLCISVCPVDCIEMTDAPYERKGETWPEFLDSEVSRWRYLVNRRRQRLQKNTMPEATAERDDIRQEIRRAVNRERTNRWKRVARAARVTESRSPIQ